MDLGVIGFRHHARREPGVLGSRPAPPQTRSSCSALPARPPLRARFVHRQGSELHAADSGWIKLEAMLPDLRQKQTLERGPKPDIWPALVEADEHMGTEPAAPSYPASGSARQGQLELNLD